MKKILIAVDDTKGADAAVRLFIELFSGRPGVTAVLVYVQKMEGRSFMDDMLGEAELSTLKEMLKNTDYQEMLDRRAARVITHFRGVLEDSGLAEIRGVVREGHPAEEILGVAREETVDMICIGTRGGRLHNPLMGSVSREVVAKSELPVLLAR